MNLPPEIIIHIISFLPPYTLFSFAFTCKVHYQLCDQKLSSLNKPLCHFLFVHKQLSRRLKVLTSSALSKYSAKCRDILNVKVRSSLRTLLYISTPHHELSTAKKYVQVEKLSDLYYDNDELPTNKLDLPHFITTYFEFETFIRHQEYLIKSILTQLQPVSQFCNQIKDSWKEQIPECDYNYLLLNNL